jgi:predicted Zn-dependent protease
MIIRPCKFFYYAFGLFLAVLAAGCSTPAGPTTSNGSAAQQMWTAEQMLWQKSEQEQRAVESSGLLYPDQALEDYLNQIAAKLQPQPAELKIRVKAIENTRLDAMAYPNGMIYINTGLLARMDNEAQLAAVLGHEIIHITRRHALRALSAANDQPALLRVVRYTLSKSGGFNDMIRFMGISGPVAPVGALIRELEAEADRLGIELMAAVGYDPKEALYIFEQMTLEIQQQGIEEPSGGSHPSVGQRIVNLQGLIDAQYPHKGAEIQNREIFLAKSARLFLDNAELEIQQGRFQVARSEVEKFMRFKPDNPRAYFLLGETYRQRQQDGDPLSALACFEHALSLDPNFAAAYKAIGIIYYKEGRRTLARKFFESCLQLAPDAPDKAYIRGYIKQCGLSEEG